MKRLSETKTIPCSKTLLEDKSNRSPLELVMLEDLKMRVDNMLCKLTPKEELVIRKRFGIGEDAPKTLEEVGADI